MLNQGTNNDSAQISNIPLVFQRRIVKNIACHVVINSSSLKIMSLFFGCFFAILFPFLAGFLKLPVFQNYEVAKKRKTNIRLPSRQSF